MIRRASVIATLTVTALIAAASVAHAGVNVLLLPDSLGDGTNSLVNALRAAGCTVEVGPLEYTWHGSNPSTSGFDVVVHLNGETYGIALPILGQQALVEFVRSGGGYVGGQWNSYEVADGRLTHMDDLVLQKWEQLTLLDQCFRCQMEWTIVQEQESHPVLEGIPESFGFFAGSHGAGTPVVFDESPSVVLMTSPSGGPAVMVREFKGGRVVEFSSAANHRSEETLQDPNIQLLYVNAVKWGVSASSIEKLRQMVEQLRQSGAINKGQANGLISKLDAAERQIDRGNLKAAENQLWAFVRQVEAWIRSGVLTQDQGGPLVEVCRDIIANLAG